MMMSVRSNNIYAQASCSLNHARKNSPHPVMIGSQDAAPQVATIPERMLQKTNEMTFLSVMGLLCLPRRKYTIMPQMFKKLRTVEMIPPTKQMWKLALPSS